MGAIHDTAGFVPLTTTTESNIGWALGAGLKINLPTWGKGDYILGQFTYAEGATNYVGSNFGAGGAFGLGYADGYPAPTNVAIGPVFDAIATTATTVQNSKGWSITGGYEHVWNPQWKTSLYGAYGKMDYSAAASAVILAVLARRTGACGKSVPARCGHRSRTSTSASKCSTPT